MSYLRTAAQRKAAKARFIAKWQRSMGTACACGRWPVDTPRDDPRDCYLDALCEVQATYLEVLWQLKQLAPRHGDWVVQKLVQDEGYDGVLAARAHHYRCR
jgi:hypothetical protein